MWRHIFWSENLRYVDTKRTNSCNFHHEYQAYSVVVSRRVELLRIPTTPYWSVVKNIEKNSALEEMKKSLNLDATIGNSNGPLLLWKLRQLSSTQNKLHIFIWYLHWNQFNWCLYECAWYMNWCVELSCHFCMPLSVNQTRKEGKITHFMREIFHPNRKSYHWHLRKWAHELCL